MILIFSKSNDEFTNDVISYLPEASFFRIGTNLGLFIDEFELTNEKLEFSISNKYQSVDSNSIESIWFNGLDLGNELDLKSSKELYFLLKDYKEEVFKGFFYETKFKTIGNVSNNKLNKLKVLKLAKEVGLNIPKTILTEKKACLIKFIQENELDQVITKRFCGEGLFREENILYDISKTSLINDDSLTHMPDNFGISLFQENIKKEFEIRTIFFNESIYSAAIFDQDIDYRIKLKRPDKPRIVPYTLPREIENKITALMSCLDMNSGSIDMILDKDSEFIFLEVNPIGQISFINNSCNYYLEEIFASYLAQN